MGSFSTPLSGLMAAQEQLQTVSNNLANQNTDGYKDQNLTFSDIFASVGSTNGAGDPIQTGSGVKVSSTYSDLTEGTPNTTNVPSNMAISGNGYFVTQNAAGQQNYTRAGDFTTNDAGQIITPDGSTVMGYPAVNGVVNTAAALQPMTVSIGESMVGKASTTVSITANLSASVTAINGGTVTPTTSASGGNTTQEFDFGTGGTVNPGTTLTVDGGTVVPTPGESISSYATALQAAIDTADPASGITVSGSNGQLIITGPTAKVTGANLTGNVLQDVTGAGPTSSLTVYDALGGSHTLDVNYTKTGPNAWTYSVTVPSADLASPGAGTSTVVGAGTLTFNPTTGDLASVNQTTPVSIPAFADGAPSMSFSNLFGTNSSNYTLTQTTSASTTSAAVTDGFPGGTLSSYNVATDGTIEGTFSSGKTFALGQVAVANFANVQGLSAVGNNAYAPTIASGSAVIGVPNTGGRGTILGGQVEQSNVNIAAEFSKLIVAQQAYSANAKSITTFNTISQATLQMIQ